MDTKGENHLLLTADILNVTAITDLATAGSCGAISLFVGTTRDNFEDKKVVSLEYEAYEPMALKQMQAICLELRQKWSDIVHIVMHHRIGLVPVGEASVVIAISSPHRATALEAVAQAIEELKKRVPIWKKEQYEGQESSWKENKESRPNPLKFNEEFCNVCDTQELASEFVQISATESEIDRRIRCFVEKKREEIDLNNIIDYARPPVEENATSTAVANEKIKQENNEAGDNDDDVTSTCARTNSTIIKQESSKGHLKVYKTQNYIGPQVVRPSYMHTSDVSHEESQIKRIKLETPDEDSINNGVQSRSKSQTILERMQIIEEHLNMRDDNKKSILLRLKALEERLLYLESISPEYRHFMVDAKPNGNSCNISNPMEIDKKPTPLLARSRKVYNIADIDAIIDEIS